MTITLTQAQKLHELGVRKESHLHWMKSDSWDNYVVRTDLERQLTPEILSYVYPAYNAEELIKLLRAKEHIQIDIYSHGDGFMFHQEGSFVAGEDDIHGSTLTEALGNKLIHDLENGIITAGEVNK